MKIGIETKFFDTWAGGLDFVSHIAACIELADQKEQYEKRILLTKNDIPFYIQKYISPFRSLAAQITKRKPIHWHKWKGFDEYYLRQAFSTYTSFQLDFPGSKFRSHLEFAHRENIDVLMPCAYPPTKHYPFQWIGYIYDFQHKYFPEFFSKKDIEERDFAFKNMLNNAKHVIVNAKAVKQDADKFIGTYSAKIHVLPFSPSPREEWLNEDRDLSSKYGITKPYFIICNQFWVHKDHFTAFKALRKFLAKTDNTYQLVCTGETSDTRNPGHFKDLLKLLDYLNLKDNVKIVGHIPKLDQIALLKKSIAVIQPTLFEGGPGGGAAYDSISLGKPLIVSDIPVNLEINKTEKVFFFKARSADALASTMQQVSVQKFSMEDSNLLRKKGIARKLACGEVLLDIINLSNKQHRIE